MVPADAFHQDNILDLAVRAIQPAGDRQPSLRTPYEAVALIGHACMVAVDFRLVGLGEEHNLGMSVCFDRVGETLINILQNHPQLHLPSPQNGTLTIHLPFGTHIRSHQLSIYSK